MSDTSLVFNLLGRDNVSRVLGVVRGAFTSAGRSAEAAMNQANVSTERLDRQIQETERHLAELNREFAATGDKTLFGKMARDRSLLTQLRRVRTEIEQTSSSGRRGGLSGFLDGLAEGPGLIGKLASALQVFSTAGDAASGSAARAATTTASMASSASAAAGPYAPLVAALMATEGALLALVSVGPAISVLGGILGSLPGMFTGGIAAVGTLKLGLFGLGDEYKRLTTATGGSSGAAKQAAAANRAVEQAARAVARAERDIKDAQKDALEAQQAINEARESASKRMRDQALDLKQARLDQKDATDAVAEAEAGVANAMRTGDPIQIKKANEALEEAKLGLERAKNRVDDLTEANAENAKKGVEGSDEVVQAKKREQDARQRVADAIEAEKEAEERLADARKQQASGGGGGGGAGQKITKLAPAARQFLNTILNLRPAFERLRLDVQEKLFAGLGDRVRTLAERWMPQLHKTLGGFAGTFNQIASTFVASASRKSFIDNMAKGAESARKALGEIGRAVAGPLVDAFGRLARASGPFLEKLGHLIARVIEKFSAWIAKADETGELDKFFKGAADTLYKIWRVGEDVVKVIGKFIKIIFPDAKKGGDTFLTGLALTLEDISDWLDNPKNQKKILDFIDGVKKIVWWFRHAADKISDFKTKATATFNIIKGRIDSLVSAVKNLPGRIGKAASGMFDGIKNAFRSALNWVIARWNNLSFRIPSVTLPVLGTIGGGSLNTPNIPFLARGGTIMQAGSAVVGDAGPELLHLPRGAQVQPLRPAAAGGRDEITLKLDFGESEFGRMMAKAVRTQPAVAAAIKSRLKVTVTA